MAPENTIESMDAAVKAGVSILEFDIQITKDGIPVVIHDDNLKRTHNENIKISTITAKELSRLTAKNNPVPTLKKVLDIYWKKIPLNIEVKGDKAGLPTAELVSKYCKKPADWNHCFISSYKPSELKEIHKFSPHTRLAMLHKYNSFKFILYRNKINLFAVGWHQSYVNKAAIWLANKFGLFTYTYTINNPKSAQKLKSQGINGVVTDFPDIIKKNMH